MCDDIEPTSTKVTSIKPRSQRRQSEFVGFWPLMINEQTLTLAITFEPQEIETSYFDIYTQPMKPFIMKPFQMTSGQWPCGLDRDLYTKNTKFGLCCGREHSCLSNTSYLYCASNSVLGLIMPNCHIWINSLSWTRHGYPAMKCC